MFWRHRELTDSSISGALTASAIWNQNLVLAGLSAIVATIGMCGYLWVELPLRGVTTYSGFMMAALLGGIVGFRTHWRDNSVSSFNTAVRIAFRIGLLHVFMQAFSEDLVTGAATSTMLRFPMTLYLYTIISLQGFVAGNLLSIALHSRTVVTLAVVLYHVSSLAGAIFTPYSIYQSLTAGRDRCIHLESASEQDLNQKIEPFAKSPK